MISQLLFRANNVSQLYIHTCTIFILDICINWVTWPVQNVFKLFCLYSVLQFLRQASKFVFSWSFQNSLMYCFEMITVTHLHIVTRQKINEVHCSVTYHMYYMFMLINPQTYMDPGSNLQMCIDFLCPQLQKFTCMHCSANFFWPREKGIQCILQAGILF